MTDNTTAEDRIIGTCRSGLPCSRALNASSAASAVAGVIRHPANRQDPQSGVSGWQNVSGGRVAAEGRRLSYSQMKIMAFIVDRPSNSQLLLRASTVAARVNSWLLTTMLALQW
jgi:hypothetical protein